MRRSHAKEAEDLFGWSETKEDAAAEIGIGLSAEKHNGPLQIAREHAQILALHNPDRTTDADEVRFSMLKDGFDGKFGNWMGAIFKTKGWQFVCYVKAIHDGSHSRMIRKWRLIG